MDHCQHFQQLMSGFVWICFPQLLQFGVWQFLAKTQRWFSGPFTTGRPDHDQSGYAVPKSKTFQRDFKVKYKLTVFRLCLIVLNVQVTNRWPSCLKGSNISSYLAFGHPIQPMEMRLPTYRTKSFKPFSQSAAYCRSLLNFKHSKIRILFSI